MTLKSSYSDPHSQQHHLRLKSYRILRKSEPNHQLLNYNQIISIMKP